MKPRGGPPRRERPGPTPSQQNPPKDPDRFADLVGDAKRLEPGPPRIAEHGTPRKSAPRGPSSNDAAPAYRRPEPENAHLAAAPGISDQQLARLRRGDPEPEERIDLHRTRLAEAKRILAKRIESARARELRCLLIVHGIGKRSPTAEAVLRDAVPEWLTKGAIARHVLALAPAPRPLGGDGATLVLLRKG